MISFFVPGNPVALKRHRTFRKNGVNMNVDPSKNDKADFLAKCREHAPETPLNGPLQVTLIHYFKRPKSHFKSNDPDRPLKDSAPVFHTSTPDADNLLKFVGDALNGIFWRDDSCIAKVKTDKRYMRDGKVGVTVIIENLPRKIFRVRTAEQ